MKKRIALTMHAGSGNHGCEAIVNSTSHMLTGQELTLFSTRPWEDENYSLQKLCQIKQEHRITENVLVHGFYFLKRLLLGSSKCYLNYRFRELFSSQGYDAAISIGGDNYCYPEQVMDLIWLNEMLNARGMQTILWGASVEPKLLEREDVRQDMERYAHIFAREQITYEALKQMGIGEERLHFYPDPAFCLETGAGVQFARETVGINVSPMVMEHEKVPGMVYRNYERLIEHILEETAWDIALIPHVVWEANDDREPLKRLYEAFEASGRVTLVSDNSCTELKGTISHLKFLVAARTHASIAAYSNQVPTLVAGYSVKAKGIAEDLFGTAQGYVVPVQELEQEDQLWEAFAQMTERETEIRRLLAERIPAYVEKAREGGRMLEKIIAEIS